MTLYNMTKDWQRYRFAKYGDSITPEFGGEAGDGSCPESCNLDIFEF